MNPKNCCKCFTLLTGSKIIGFLSTIGACFFLYELFKLFKELEEVSAFVFLLINLITGGTFQSDNYSEVMKDTRIVTIIILVLTIIYLISCIFLLIGLFKQIPRLMMPYIVMEALNIFAVVISAIFSIWAIFKFFYVSNNDKSLSSGISIGIPFGTCIFWLLMIGVRLYFWSVVRATKNEMRASQNKINEIESNDDSATNGLSRL